MIPSLFNSTGTAPAANSAVPAGTQSDEPTEIKKAEPSVIEKELQIALNEAIINYPVMVEKSNACSMALSKLKKIETDEEDETTEKLLVKSRKTYEVVKEMREKTTKRLDAIKKILMEPEKKISTDDSQADSGYVKGKAFRNVYANEKLAKQQEEAKEAKRIELETLELTRLKGEFQSVFNNNVSDYIATMETAIATFFNGLSLEKPDPKEEGKVLTWADQIKRFSMKPALKKETFESWFEVPYDKTKITPEVYTSFVDGVKELYTYDVINDIYVGQAQPKVDEYKKKLPAKKKELEKIAELEKTNAAEAQLQKDKLIEDNRIQLEKIASENEKNKAATAETVQKNQRNESLEAQFNTLKVVNEQENIGGKKKQIPIITGDPKAIVEILSQVLYHCFVHPDFKGIYKKDKQGVRLPDDANGMPAYEDWAKPFLNFWAENTDAEIDGIVRKEVISTIQGGRGKKSE